MKRSGVPGRHRATQDRRDRRPAHRRAGRTGREPGLPTLLRDAAMAAGMVIASAGALLSASAPVGIPEPVIEVSPNGSPTSVPVDHSRTAVDRPGPILIAPPARWSSIRIGPAIEAAPESGSTAGSIPGSGDAGPGGTGPDLGPGPDTGTGPGPDGTGPEGSSGSGGATPAGSLRPGGAGLGASTSSDGTGPDTDTGPGPDGAGPGSAEHDAFSVPVEHPVLSSPFGYRVDPVAGTGLELHTGLDYAGACGLPVTAVQAGIVVDSGWHAHGGGLRVVIDHGGGLATTYNHLGVLEVPVGASIGRGAPLGTIGSSGNSTGCHLHFEVLVEGEKVDPAPWL